MWDKNAWISQRPNSKGVHCQERPGQCQPNGTSGINTGRHGLVPLAHRIKLRSHVKALNLFCSSAWLCPLPSITQEGEGEGVVNYLICTRVPTALRNVCDLVTDRKIFNLSAILAKLVTAWDLPFLVSNKLKFIEVVSLRSFHFFEEIRRNDPRSL